MNNELEESVCLCIIQQHFENSIEFKSECSVTILC